MAYYIAFISVSIGVGETGRNTYSPTPKWTHYHLLQWFKIVGCLANFYKQAYLHSLISEAVYVMHEKRIVFSMEGKR